MLNTTPCGCGTKTHHGGKCQCGCADCPPEACCDLECLERPRFFCGQLLTDQDFNALAEWVDRKSALKRFLHGWGVVCGLDVSLDPCDGMSICISPGYAIDCCGRDLVVCDPLCISLQAKYCTEPQDPCGKLGKTAAVVSGGAVSGSAGPGADFKPYGVADGVFTWIDVYARYDEQQERPQRQPSSGSCSSDTPVCQYTRVKQIPEIFTQATPLAALNPAPDKYQTQVKAILSDLTDPQFGAGADAVNRYLAGAYKTKFGGLHRFAFISTLAQSSAALPQQSGHLAYWLVQDWVLAFAAHCGQCDDSVGVPVARVLLRKDPATKVCSIVYIEQASHSRRPLTPFPMPQSATPLAPYLWRPLDADMRTTLTNLNIGVRAIEPSKMALADVQTEFEAGAFWQTPADVITALAVPFPNDAQQRIALFRRKA